MNRLFVLLFVAFIALATLSDARRSRRGRDRGCSGSAEYEVTFTNYLARTSPCRPFKMFCYSHRYCRGTRCIRKFSVEKAAACFATIVPEAGLAFSPITAVTHSPSFSLFRVGEKVSMPVEDVCERGTNVALLAAARASGMTSSDVGDNRPIMAGQMRTVRVTATCKYPYLSVLSMIAPSPDWVVQLNNMPLVNKRGQFIKKRYGNLIAYDCGTDDGSDFTDPGDASLDIPTMPKGKLIPLFKDTTDPFGKKSVGLYKIERIA